MRALLLVACLLLVAGAMGSTAQSSAASQLASLAAEPPHSGPDKCDSGCDVCSSDEDCIDMHFCYTSTTNGQGFCRPYAFFEHYSWRVILGPILIFLTACIAAGSGGTGAGVVNVPVLLMVQSLVPAEAVVTSQAAIMGGSLAGLLMYAPRSHPFDKARSIFEVDVVLLLLPAMLCGTLYGILFNTASPYWFVFTLLIFIALWGVWKTIGKFRTLWNLETQQKAAAARIEEESAALIAAHEHEHETHIEVLRAKKAAAKFQNSDGSSIEAADLAPATKGELTVAAPAMTYTSFAPPKNNEDELAAIDAPKTVTLRDNGFAWKMWCVVGLFVIVGVLNLLRGGKPGQISVAGIEFCSTDYWIFTGLETPALIALSVVIGVYLVRRTAREKQFSRFDQDVDLDWNTVRVIWYPIMAFFAGVFASMIGFGGGLLLSPLMLDLGIAPQSVAATSALIHILSSCAAVVNYSIAGKLLLQHAAIFFVVSFLGQFVGQTVVDHFVKKYQRPSIIALMIVIMVSLASLMLIVSGGLQVRKDILTGTHLVFKSFC